MTPLALLASLASLGYTACYLLMCAAFPFGHCRRCKGAGKLYSPFSRRVFRLCPRCDGTGRRVRIGRRIYEYFRSEHAKGHK